jgi:hypothetical protein
MTKNVDLDTLLRECGIDPASVPKYMELPDGSIYFYVKEEHKDALCEQAPSLQKGIPTAKGSE